MRVIAYASASRESMYAIGETKLGLSGESLDYFSFALTEIKVELEVNLSTGAAEVVAVNGVLLARVGGKP